MLVPFSVYFVRPDFVGNDTYGFLGFVCKNDNSIGLSGIQFTLFSLLPCNILALKGILFACAFVSGCFVIKLASLFSKENGWRASYLLFFGSVFVLEFAKLENDQFAFPFLFASLYFFFKGMKTGKRLPYFCSLALLLAAGLLWQGAIFYLLAYAFNVWMLWLFLAPLVLIPFPGNSLHWRSLFGIIVRTQRVAEDMAFQFYVPFISVFGLFGVVTNPILMPQAIFLFALGVASAKFWILSVPFLVVGLVLVLEQADKDVFYQASFFLGIVLAFGLAQSLWLNPPQEDHWQAIDYAMELGNGEINNDWGFGYWVRWRGGDTNSFASFLHQQPLDKGCLPYVSEQDLNYKVLKEFGRIRVYTC